MFGNKFKTKRIPAAAKKSTGKENVMTTTDHNYSIIQKENCLY